MGGKIKFTYPIESGDTLLYTYKMKDYVSTITTETDTEGVEIETITYTNTFTVNESVFLLNEELLILGILYQRSVMNGFSDLPLREKDYFIKLKEEMGKDGGLRKTNIIGDDRTFNKTTGSDWSRYE